MTKGRWFSRTSHRFPEVPERSQPAPGPSTPRRRLKRPGFGYFPSTRVSNIYRPAAGAAGRPKNGSVFSNFPPDLTPESSSSDSRPAQISKLLGAGRGRRGTWPANSYYYEIIMKLLARRRRATWHFHTLTFVRRDSHRFPLEFSDRP